MAALPKAFPPGHCSTARRGADSSFPGAVLCLDRVHLRLMAKNIKVTKVLSQDRVRPRLVEQNITIMKVSVQQRFVEQKIIMKVFPRTELNRSTRRSSIFSCRTGFNSGWWTSSRFRSGQSSPSLGGPELHGDLQGLVPGQGSAALLGGLQGVLPGQSSTDRGGVGRSASSRRLRLTDAAARWQAQDPGPEFWPKRACKFFCQQGQACTFARSVHRLHPDAEWGEFMQLFFAGEQDF